MSYYLRTEREKRYFEAYKLMIQAKENHHQSYTRWMNFFYVAEAAVLYAYITPHGNSKILLLLGFLFSLLGYLSCRGYYFWTHNWIDQIYRLEKKFDGELRVYSTFSADTRDESKIIYPLEPANLSTFRLAIFFFLSVYVLWAFLLMRDSLKTIQKIIHLTPNDLHVQPSVFCFCGAALIVIMSLLVVYVFRGLLETHWLNKDDPDRWINCRNEKI